jgi:transcription factor SFP1
MFDYSDSPPALHHSPATSERTAFASRDSTPITPVGFDPGIARRPDKDKDHSVPWFRKPIDIGKPTTSLCLDSTLLEPDFDDHSFPLFGSSPPQRAMVATSSLINISPRQASTSPRLPQSSNLTSALQRSDSSGRSASAVPTAAPPPVNDASRQVPAGDGCARLENGARPIQGADSEKARRESIAQSFNTGMSWGGISVGSWIRDEYVHTRLLALGPANFT